MNGCESPDPEIEDSMEPGLDVNDKYRKYEMVTQMNNRQRVCVSKSECFIFLSVV